MASEADLRDGVGPRLKNHGEQAQRAAYFFQFAGRCRARCGRARGRWGRATRRRRARLRSWTASFAAESSRRSTRARESSPRLERGLRFGCMSSALAARISRRGVARARRDRFERLIALLDGSGGDASREACLAASASARISFRSRTFPWERRACRRSCRRRIASRTPGVRPLAMTAGGRLRWRCARLRAWFPCRRGRGHCRRAR